MKFGTLNVRSLYRSGSLTTVARELTSCKLDLVGVQEVRWDRRGHSNFRGFYLFQWKRNDSHQIGASSLYTTEYYLQFRE